MGGAGRQSGHTDQDAFIVKVDRQGQIEWTRVIGGDGEQGLGCPLVLENELRILGGTDSQIYPLPFLMCLNATGEEQWRRIVDEDPAAWGISTMAPAPAGGIAISGVYRDFPQPVHPYLMRLDSPDTRFGCGTIRWKGQGSPAT